MTSHVREGNFSHDAFAWKLATCLLEDFKPFVSQNFYDAASSAFAECNVEKMRALTCGNFELKSNGYQLKTTRQICDLFKKFSFLEDLHTPTQLRDDSIKKFMDNQERLLNFRISDDQLTKSIIFGARGYVDQILGEFSHLEICQEATFGKKSSVGIPMRKACEGERYEAPITGSNALIEWHEKYYSAWNRPAFNYAVARAVLHQKPLYRSVNILEAVLVDKTWKSLRMIMPNTTLGTLYSGGLGKVIEGRLRNYGYDIKHLQPVHGTLAKFGSITGSLVTADQSMASDNITCQLIDAIFPRKWASALNYGRIEEIALYGARITTPTFSTMGIGFTFPLQTLVFLSLLLSIRDHCELDTQAVVSVFGDDLVYDERMHSIVMDVFPKLGLVINAEKTFSTGYFRESCGYDYFHGIDVRPFHLGRVDTRSAGKRRTEAYLYTALNGLLRRWNVYEVPFSSAMILEEIRKTRGDEALVVPVDYPDTSGIKASPEVAFLLGIERKIKLKYSDSLYHFRFLAFEPDLKIEPRNTPYFFRTLFSDKEYAAEPPLLKANPDFIKKWARGHGKFLLDSPSMLKWMKDLEGRPIRDKNTGRRYRPLFSFIPSQDKGRYRERPGVTGNWTLEYKTKSTKV